MSFEVGLHQCPSEKKGKVVPSCARHVASHVPVHAPSAANRGVLRVEAGGSLLRQTRCWRKADSNRWSHLTYDGDAFQNTYPASPGLQAPKVGPAQNGMRSDQPFERLLVMRRRGDIAICWRTGIAPVLA
jgi:hypothetical protein